MSTYTKETKHPTTGEWEQALWLDDKLGRHHYGVEFPSEKGKYYDPEQVDLETREKNTQQGAAKTNDARVPAMEKQSVTYRVKHTIECTSASHEEPHLCKNRTIEADVTVYLPSGAVTVKKVNAPSNGYGNSPTAYSFVNSDPQLVRAIGEVLIAAANASDNTKQSTL